MSEVKCYICKHMSDPVWITTRSLSGQKTTCVEHNCLATKEIQLNIFGTEDVVYNLCSSVNRDGKCRLYELCSTKGGK